MNIRCSILFLWVTVNVSAQTFRIDSLKKKQPTLQGRAQVNCLNAIGREFNFNFIHSDSAMKYANLAYALASNIEYNTGKAVALLTQGDVRGRLLGDIKQMERNSEQAIAILKKENDQKNLSTAYHKLAIALGIQGQYALAHKAALKAEQSAMVAKDKSALAWAIEAAGFIYCKSGEHWKGFEKMNEAQKMGKELHDSLLTFTALAFIGRSFNRVGDPNRALNYYHQSLPYATPFILLFPHLEDMAYAHLVLKQYDSVFYYQQKHRHNVDSLTTDMLVRKNFSSFLWGYSVEAQLAIGQYDNVMVDILPELDRLRKNKDVIPLMQSLLTVGKVYQGKLEYTTALRFGRELLQIARATSNKEFLKEAYQLNASLFEHLNQADSAYFYFKEFSTLKDAMEAQQFQQRTALYIAASEAENRINLLKKDKEINEQQLALHKKELQKQSLSNNILVGSLITVFLFFMLVVRNNILKRRNEKLRHDQAQLTLKRKTLELEMQALRAQMNPHFIFNCLSAIDNLIQTGQSDKATSCLARFAKLIRLVLDSSKNNLVPFQKDFETIRLYLEMEQFRCNNKFSYSLTANQELSQGDYKVPPLIIQPFIENAIHHGLLNKQSGSRLLEVSAELNDAYIIYSITDNGIGRKKAGILKALNRPEHQSYGLDISRERVQLHNGNGMSAIQICDLEEDGKPTGTKAVVRINSFEN